ncbi:alpha/beta fold hydrolase [Halorussus sp. MSC15.2]|uniref:alpha/beta fold hydrolase n=1 Tax=Halorussus sp. MSC15.2 TaxID=2283638 RepID=UPI0013D8AEB7|nr:alpha/beta hydrolase [Halorussus sp. MSC15.2]NEU56891.1 alpha/beta hydrolase [Halorussus sp. MSC15.2]
MASHEEWTNAQQHRDVTVDGKDLDMAYYDEGEGDPVVLLHGIPTWSYLWRDVAEALTDDRRVVVPDMVGYGNSAMHDEFDRSIRAQELAVADLLDGLGLDTVSFVGHDLGGGVGLRYAVHRPDAVDKLVLSNAIAYDAWPVEPIVNIGLPSTAKEKSVEEIQETLDGMFRQSLASDDPSDEFVEGMKAPWNSERGMVSLVRDAAATNTNHTTEIDPSEITADTLLLWGADDEFQPIESAERLEGDIESAQVVGLDDANHWVLQDRPERYVEELRSFLLDGESA